MDNDDKQAVVAVQRGDINAFEVIVRRYTAEVVRFISGKTNDERLVDDVVQSAFIKLYKAVDKLDFSRPIKPYLFQIAKNELYEEWAKGNKQISLNDSLVVDCYNHDGDNSTRIDEARQAIRSLKSDQQKALVWFSEGYSYQEIAHKMGKPINTVRTLIHRARLFIKHKLNI